MIRDLSSRAFSVFLIVVLMLCASAVQSVNASELQLLDIAQVIKSSESVTTDVYPNSDFVVLDEYYKVEYNADGTYRILDDEYIKVLTEKGKRRYQSVSQYYTLPYGTAAFEKLEVIKPDGEVIAVDIASNSRVMVNPGQMGANIYNPNSKILKAGIPGLEIGDVLHIISSDDIVKARVPNTWSDNSVFEHTAPIKHMILDIDGPKNLPLVNIRLRDEIDGTVIYTNPPCGNGRKRYLWEVKDVPRMFPEPKMPSLYTVVQRLLVSTIPDWETISRWYWNLSKLHLDAVTPEMKSKVAELTEGITDREEKIRRIFMFVSKQIRYMGITTETTAPGYEPHDVSLTFGNRYGVCRDKAALLAAMLRLADLPAYPVLIFVGTRKDEDVPQPFFNHAVVAVGNDDGSYSLMDPTDENTTELFPAYLSFMSYLVAHPEGEGLRTSPVTPASENLLEIDTTGELSSDGRLELTSHLKFNGINDNAYRGSFTRMKPEERQQFFEGRLKQRFAGAKLTGYTITPEDMQDTSERLSVTLEYEVRDYPTVGDDHTLLPAPWLGTGFGYANFLLGTTGLDKRKYPYYIRLTAGVRESIKIEMDNSNSKSVQESEFVDLEAAGVTYSQSIGVNSNLLIGSADFMIDSVLFSPAEYLELKQFLKDREYEQRKKVILTHADASDEENDIRILSDDIKVDIRDKSTWTITRNMRKKILTYAGKKANSELKIGFNPAWETIRLVSAKVENPDGSTHTVVEEEKNLMDSSWVGSAPRYPPARILVVSLPGVEVGSLISYEIERKVFGKPFFSMQKTFRQDDPVDASSVEIYVPENLPLHIIDDTESGQYMMEEGKGYTAHIWKIGPQTAIKPEKHLPPRWSFLPTLFVSTGDWESYSDEINKRLVLATTNQPQSEKKALELTADAETTRDKILAIRNFVARNIRNAGPSFTSLPFDAVTAADTVLSDGYGNTADHAVLLATMLKACGIESEFIMISSWSPELDSLTAPLIAAPQRNLFGNVLVWVIDGRQTYYLNETDQYAELGTTPFDSKKTLNRLGQISAVELPEKMSERSLIDFDLKLAVSGDATLTAKRSYFGMAFAHNKRRYAELPPEELRRHFMELTASVSQSAKAIGDLETQFDDYPGYRKFSVDIEKYAVRSGKYLYVTLPSGMGDVLYLQSESREQEFYRGSPVHQTVNYDIKLPVNTKKVHLMPSAFNWRGPNGLGDIEYTQEVDSNNGHILITQKVDFNPAVIRPESYPMLLDLTRQLKHPSMRTILIELENDISNE